MARACVLNIAVIAWFWSDWELGAAWAEETGKKTNKRKHKGGAYDCNSVRGAHGFYYVV